MLKRATSYLEAHGSTSPRLDAEVLLAHLLGLRRLDLYLQFERVLGESELAPYRQLVDRRGRDEPVAYLVGRKEFMKLDFEVTPDVLIPNPDTELLVQRAVALVREMAGEVRVADVGTGSGCIAISVAHYAANARVYASDDSPAALAVAGRNARLHGLAERIELLEGDLLAPLPDRLDLVCANLPYVDRAAQLSADVLAQPHHALFAGAGGAALVRRLLREAPAKLVPAGRILVETHPALIDGLASEAAGIYAGHAVHMDLGGYERLLEAWEPRPRRS